MVYFKGLRAHTTDYLFKWHRLQKFKVSYSHRSVAAFLPFVRRSRLLKHIEVAGPTEPECGRQCWTPLDWETRSLASPGPR